MVETAPKITLVLGGARSGKSALAEKIAHTRAGDSGVLYVATLQPFDAEMRERVVSHQTSRPVNWRTLETPYNLAGPVLENLQAEKLVLLDCLTVWASNRLLRDMEPGLLGPAEIFEDLPGAESAAQEPPRTEAIQPFDYKTLESEMALELEKLLAGLKEREAGLVLVSNEVGMGLVPPYPLGRVYRDLLGRLNQRVAALADEVFLVVAGIPVDLKKFEAAIS
jgi:adenosylcobinamide kinase/adenosylcobinamide-phosphate guanylyltransferase